jgi:hypothetical protein
MKDVNNSNAETILNFTFVFSCYKDLLPGMDISSTDNMSYCDEIWPKDELRSLSDIVA